MLVSSLLPQYTPIYKSVESPIDPITIDPKSLPNSRDIQAEQQGFSQASFLGVDGFVFRLGSHCRKFGPRESWVGVFLEFRGVPVRFWGVSILGTQG